MNTPYDKVYQAFLDKITDYELPLMGEDAGNKALYRLMTAACSKFRACKTKLSDRDDSAEVFRNELSDDEIDIITENMVVRWLKPQVNSVENMRNTLNSKDFNGFAPAHLLSEIRKTYNESKAESLRLMREYSIVNGNIANLKVR